MIKPSQFSFFVGVALLFSDVSSASIYSVPVATDVYGVSQGGVVNGIPTANDDNDGVPDINDAINLLQGTALARNVDADPLFVAADEVWKNLNGTVALIGLSAGFSNTIGVYTDVGTGAVQTPLLGPYSGFGFTGDGTAANPFPATLIGLGVDTDFGWYLSANGVTDYFSESALNPLGFDHMMTFDLPGANGKTIYVDTGTGATAVTLNDPFLIAWEDLPFNDVSGTLGDDDYDDMMYIVDRVAAIPEPLSLVVWSLLGLTVTGSAVWQRRKKRRAVCKTPDASGLLI